MEEKDMRGKVCIVTGSNSGIGKVTARVLAMRGATVVMICRNPDKANPVLEEIKTGSGNDKVELLLADLSKMGDIRSVAEEFKKKYDRLDVLINNAGVIVSKRTLTEDGYETTFAVSHLAPFLLTHELLDILKASAPSRVINVSSEGHRLGTINFNNLQGEKFYNFMLAYGSAKLAEIMFTYEMAGRIDGSGVDVNALHPGGIASNFGIKSGGLVGLSMKLSRPFLISSEKGARTSLYLATSPEVEGTSGKYFNKSRAVKSSKKSYNKKTSEKLWDITAGLTGIK